MKFSPQARRLAQAAKDAGLLDILEPEDLELPETFPAEDPVGESTTWDEPDSEVISDTSDLSQIDVPLNRKMRRLVSLSDHELTLAYEQASRRCDGLTPQNKNYDRYKGYLSAIEKLVDARAPELSLAEPEAPRHQPLRIPVDEDSLPFDRGNRPGDGPNFRNDRGMRFHFPGDTPESRDI